jgi:DNA transformation protein
MARDQLIDHCLELLASLGAVRSRRMFGGHGIYIDDLFMALVASDVLYLKVGDDSRPLFQVAGCRPFVYDAKSGSVALGYWSAPPEAMESPALMQPWARLALQAALEAANARMIKRRSVAVPAKRRSPDAARPSAAKPAAKGRPPR